MTDSTAAAPAPQQPGPGAGSGSGPGVEPEAPRDGSGTPRGRRGGHRRRSSRLGLAAPLALWAVTRAVLLLCVFKVFTLPGPDFTNDVNVIYQGWYGVLKSGVFPADDVTWQYPPAAALAILSPMLLPFLDYPTAFYWLACAADAVVFALLLHASRATRTTRATGTTGTTRPPGDPGRRRAGVWGWIAGVALLGPTAYARYDLMVTAVAVGALLAGARHPRAAGALAGFGAMLKVWPALLLLGTERGRETRTAWSAAVVTGLVVMGLFAATMPGAFAFLEFQQGRGTEVESLGALALHVARQFGWEGQVLLNYGSMEFVGPYVNLVSDAALLLTLLAFAWLLLWRLRAVQWTPSTPADAALTAVLLFTTTSRVISPQYMIWLVGLSAVCLTLRASRQTAPALLTLAATAVTLLEFPLGFAHVVASDWLGLLLMTVRNGLLVAASLLACLRLWRSTRPAAPAGALPSADVTTAPSVRTSATAR